MGFLAGVVKELNRQEDAATRAEEFMTNMKSSMLGPQDQPASLAFIDLLFNKLFLGETTIRSFRPKLCITRATIPIFSGS